MTTRGKSLLAAAGLILAGCTAASLWRPSEMRLRQDLTYCARDDGPLRLDLARPRRGKGPFPVVVCLHGGAWAGGSKRDCRWMLEALAKQGLAGAAVQYRLAPAHRFPAQLDDVRDALRFLRRKAAELEVDPDRIGLVGFSAGGHLALLAGLDGPEPGVRAAASVAGPTDLRGAFPGDVDRLVVSLIGAPRDRDPGAYARASPVVFVRKDGPPVLMLHGTADPIVPYSQAEALLAACRKAGAPAELVTIQEGGHGGGGPPGAWAQALGRLPGFFERSLRAAGGRP